MVKFFRSCILAGFVYAASSIAWAVPVLVAPEGIGNGNNGLPFSTSGSIRLQIETDASAFSSLSGPMYLTALDFVNTGGGSQSNFAGSSLSVGLTNLSHGSLTNNLDANYLGSLTLVASSYSLVQNPDSASLFDLQLVFDTPFLYDPSLGNLILDFQDAETVEGPTISDVTGTVSQQANSLGGARPTLVQVAQYEFSPVPEIDSRSAILPLSMLFFFALGVYDVRRKNPSLSDATLHLKTE